MGPSQLGSGPCRLELRGDLESLFLGQISMKSPFLSPSSPPYTEEQGPEPSLGWRNFLYQKMFRGLRISHLPSKGRLGDGPGRGWVMGDG